MMYQKPLIPFWDVIRATYCGFRIEIRIYKYINKYAEKAFEVQANFKKICLKLYPKLHH